MKALTLTQPWATLVVIGAKRIETRSWGTKYRGRLAIHAAKSYPRWARNLAVQEPFFTVLHQAGYPPAGLYLGCVIATAELVACWRVPVNWWTPEQRTEVGLSDLELAFGDFTPGRYLWFLKDVQPLEPVPARGSLGLWDWQDDPG